jgi:TolB-like protein/DNA-binding winged helix-turn-helix (wHTH) protein
MDLTRRTLVADGTPAALHARAFDILEFLIRRREAPVTREEIMDHVWRGVVVGDNNLPVQLSALRRVLAQHGGADLIVTVPHRGYQFVERQTDNAAPLAVLLQAQDPTGHGLGHSAVAGGEAATLAKPSPPSEPVKHPPGHIALPSAPGLFADAGSATLTQFAYNLAWKRGRLGFIAASACLLSGAAVLSTVHWLHGVSPRFSLVVLPFRTLDGPNGQTYLADSVTDDLTTDLSHVPGSLVIARTSADAFRGKTMPVEQIGRALHVAYVLEGSVRNAQGQLRVNAQLIDAANGSHIWAEHFDGSAANLWETQNDIVRRIAIAVDAALLHMEVTRIERKRPGNQDALDLFFRARSIGHRDDTLATMSEAQHLLEAAIAAEPDFLEALSALGWLLARKLQLYDYPTYVQDDVEADRVTAHALALAPQSAGALAARGRYLAYRGKCAAASSLFDTALATEPGNVQALSGQVNCAWQSGQTDRVLELEKALLRVDPEGSATRLRHQLLGLAYLFSGRSAQAVDALRRADPGGEGGSSSPDSVSPVETTRLYLIAALVMNGQLDEAKAHYATFRALWPHRTVWREMMFFTASQEHMPAFARVGDALVEAGVPRFADERSDDHLPSSATPLDGAEFTPTPLSVPGVETVYTETLAARLHAKAPPLVIDVGLGRAMPGALLLSDHDLALDRNALLATSSGRSMLAARNGFVVMGTSCYGVNGYNATLRLRDLGFSPMAWYRGGEEAWASHNMPVQIRNIE